MQNPSRADPYRGHKQQPTTQVLSSRKDQVFKNTSTKRERHKNTFKKLVAVPFGRPRPVIAGGSEPTAHSQMFASINSGNLTVPFSLHAGEQPGSHTQPLLLQSYGKRAVPAEHGHSLISFIKVFPSEMLLKLLLKTPAGI